MNFQETIILGVISSIIATIVCYLFSILIKPKFTISKQICVKNVDDQYTDYMIKVVNKTRTFITNINYSLIYSVEIDDELCDIRTVEPLKVPLVNLDGYNKNNTDYAVRITYRIKNSEYPLNDKACFMFTFQANHSFSNSMKIEKVIYKKDSLKEGIFETGKSTKILSH